MYRKMKKNNTTLTLSEQFQDLIEKIAETEEKRIHLTQIYMAAHFPDLRKKMWC